MSNKNIYRIYQLPIGNNNIFRHYKGEVSSDDYCCVWADEFIDTAKTDEEICEDLYYRFNCDHPKGFGGHSMSVSDVIELNNESGRRVYFCDAFGFKRLDNFR